MLNKIIRITIATALFAWSVYEFYLGHIGNGIFILFLMGIVIFTIYRHEMMLLAFWFVRKGNFKKAEKYLGYIKKPETSLVKGQVAYYYFLHGLINAQTNLKESEKYFKKALKKGLRLDHDKALAKLQLAGMAMQRRRKREATMLLNEVKKLDKTKMLKEQVDMMRQNLGKI
ncbi:hypothetical protein C7377_1227 [Balneicella halophila]|uniref:Tetratricopeptide repeat protein n=1 Tax=Balneicella halophila TaxID=1537566 RepID=A0A7L4UPE1_BALHA|nr:DUF2892 domain-containing protein [Balneicella halophila]PVX50904.1 hypothetical protein C7377_1227 [Balneicella halophila]